MTARRVPGEGLVDGARPLSFGFDGRRVRGFAGDTVASALIAAGERVVGRSFKYHRPRGFWGAWVEDPNGLADITLRGQRIANCQMASTPLEAGMEAEAANAWPSARRDVAGLLDLAHPFFAAGFYYKTFKWPDWHLFEPMIRRLAGLGRAGGAPEDYRADQLHDRCDVLVVGAGAAGLAAARAAAEAGRSVILVDDHPHTGGGVWRRGLPIEGKAPAAWVADETRAIEAAGGRVLLSTTALGLYDHRLAALAEDRGFARAPRLWRVRAERVVLATGAIERPLAFENNDRPGIMSAEAAAEYLGRYGLLVGQTIALVSNNTGTERVAERLSAAGAEVKPLDATRGPARPLGGRRLEGVELAGRRTHADTVLVSGGHSPTVHLWRHAGGKLGWDEEIAAFRPAEGPDWLAVAGAANGTHGLDHALDEARALALGRPAPQHRTGYAVSPLWPDPHAPGRQWIDFQNDVTAKDIALAHRENYASVEHLKRYTTLGMGTDQGKTSNIAGLAAMASLAGATIPGTGTTTFRPPYTPQPLELYRGSATGQDFAAPKRLVLEPRHRDAGARLRVYGGTLRPAWYGDDREAAVRSEALTARGRAGIYDASPLGKIEVMGPDAAAFMDFVCYNTVSTLAAGRLRYVFLLTETGTVMDDAVVARLGEHRFLLSCSSAHVDAVATHLDTWRQDGHDPDRVFVHDTTAEWATVTVTGPAARAIVEGLAEGADLSSGTLPPMALAEARFGAAPMRIARASFTGDPSFELSVPASAATALWDAALTGGRAHGAVPIGIEALSILRAEKGFIMVGKDTDGETMPHDLGMDGPRACKTAAYVGDRGLFTETACREDRRQLVGLAVAEGEPPLPTGGHLMTPHGHRSEGFVTSSYQSPVLGRPIALGLLEAGRARMGERVAVWHLGRGRMAEVVPPVFLDPKGERLHG